MTKIILAASLGLLLAGALLPASANAADKSLIVVEQAPPLARHERAPKPRRGYVWVEGYWTFRGKHYAWQKGRWVLARPGYEYQQARWVKVPGGWELRQGGWRRPAEAPLQPQ
ncbi:YXWGXW repeat-containing protein [Paraburkholderia sabiae]|uniref:YXWGXW repeat-containing protein n=1 Tax=Paraburkholderia sabiae TaxID=273251 RepID=A0ABU9QQS4_9BURK|nr:YXWGXW repeat-containing protein [Paraburkholderia sabiae]WJZ72307.1 YXWGXW repeat-containing protein [Paraburkholderia sabiae]CAD6537934.1 hypothetical protein LMG24235_03276 [Paraburkholderia sabiae]